MGREKFSIIFVTHDVKEAVFIADRIFFLSGRPSRLVDEVTLNERALSLADERLFEMEKRVIERLLNLPL